MIAEGWLERLGRAPRRASQSSGRRTAARRTGPAGRARVRIRLPRPRALFAIAALVAALAGGWLWFRDSSLVAVRKVTVVGASGPDAARIKRALLLAGRNMTTLDVKVDQLNSAVAPYPLVKSLSVSSQFPHGLRIQVTEQVPVGVVSLGGRTEAIASDGTLLRDAGHLGQLPVIQLATSPGGNRITGGIGRQLVAVLAAAPYRLISQLSGASYDVTHGLTAQVRGGPAIYFGGADRLEAKWRAAIAVLSASSSAGAGYVDVTDPVRPAAGAGTPAGTASSTTGSTSTASAATGGTGTGTAGATGSTPAVGPSGTASTPGATAAGTGPIAPSAGTSTASTGG